MSHDERIWLIGTVVGAALVAFAVVVAEAIRRYGANNVQAFAGVMSFVAVVVAAIATVIYVLKTADIAQATRETSREQARVARLMEFDLRFRTTPHLRYKPIGGEASRPAGFIVNEGIGMALDVRGKVRLIPSDREVEIASIPVLEARTDPGVKIGFTRQSSEDAYVVTLTCTDSLELNDYCFEWDNSPRLLSRVVTPRS